MAKVKDLDDPRRCQATASNGGQCHNIAVEGYEYCKIHGGQEAKHEQSEVRDYLTEQFARRITVKGDFDEVKLLRENLLRVNAMLAVYGNKIKDEASLASNADRVLELTIAADRLTKSLNTLAISSGLLLGKNAVKTYAIQMVQAMADTIQDKYEGWEDDLIELSDQVSIIISALKNEDE